jgi:hypothetical protein
VASKTGDAQTPDDVKSIPDRTTIPTKIDRLWIVTVAVLLCSGFDAAGGRRRWSGCSHAHCPKIKAIAMPCGPGRVENRPLRSKKEWMTRIEPFQRRVLPAPRARIADRNPRCFRHRIAGIAGECLQSLSTAVHPRFYPSSIQAVEDTV